MTNAELTRTRYDFLVDKFGPDIPVHTICKEYFGVSPEAVRQGSIPVATYKTKQGTSFVCAYHLAQYLTKLAEQVKI